jgi:hypothetical protein
MVGATFTVAAAAEVLRSKKGITAYANAQVDTAQSYFGGASAYFDGVGDHLRVAHDSSLKFGTGNFTIEFWYRPIARTNNFAVLLSNTSEFVTGNIQIDDRNNSTPTKFSVFIVNNSNSAASLVSTTTVANGTWYHLALVRNGTNIGLYVNGTSEASITVASNFVVDDSANTTGYQIGAYYNGDSTTIINGHIDEIRISNSARYTTNFSVATAPFVNDANTVLLIHADGTDAATFFEDDNGVRAPKGIIAVANAQVDTAQSYFGGSSALFDGNTDLLSVNGGIFLTADFTIEMWFRSGNTTGQLFGNVLTNTGPVAGQVVCYYAPGNQRLEIYFSDSTSVGYVTNTTMAINTWYHIAMVRSGSTIRCYVNGTQQSATKTFSGELGTATYPTWHIGGIPGNLDCFIGHIDEIRFSDSARYTTTFTPSTTPFVNDANTLLLIHANGFDTSTVFLDDNQNKYLESTVALTDDSSTELLLHMNGSAGGTTFTDDNSTGRTAKTLTRTSVTTETAQTKFGTASMLSSTASAYGLVVTGTTNLLTWHNTDFCAEAWIYPTSFTDISGPTVAGVPVGKVMGNQARTGSSSYWGFGPTSSGALCWYMWDPSIGSRGFITPQTPITLNTWQHIAVQHTLGNRLLTFFCNGNKIGEWGVTSHTNLAVDNATGLCVGGYDGKGFPGYIDEVRISRTVRY